MTQHREAFSSLSRRLGDHEWSCDSAECYAASMDNLRYSRLPSVRIYPDDEASVGAVLELANAFKVPVTVRGAGSATTGTTTPTEGGWVLDLSRWTQISIDPVARMAFVQPGATVAAIDEAAQAHGLSYPVDPGSREYASIGGTISTNAGGMRAAKYGVTRDYVLSLEGFLPTGEFVRWAGNYRKYAAGFNMRDLWIGAEGSLGVITGAILRLIPMPAARGLGLALFDRDASAIAAAKRLLNSAVQPSACEFLDTQTVGCTIGFWRKKSPALIRSLPDCLQHAIASSHIPAALIFEMDGPADSILPQLDAAASLLGVAPSQRAMAITEDAMQSLWKLRKSCSQAMFELGSRKLNEDVVVPVDAYEDLMALLHEIGQQYALPTPTFGHIADGNFHVHLMFNDSDPQQSARAAEAIHHLMQGIVDLGGAISGEHGIGIAKSEFLPLQLSPAEIAAMQAIKSALDPHLILNPGKIFSPIPAHSLKRESVKLPWDH